MKPRGKTTAALDTLQRPNQKLAFPEIDFETLRPDLARFFKTFVDHTEYGHYQIYRDSTGALNVDVTNWHNLAGPQLKPVIIGNYVLTPFGHYDRTIQHIDKDGREFTRRYSIFSMSMVFFDLKKNFNDEELQYHTDATRNDCEYFKSFSAIVRIISRLDVYLDNPLHSQLIDLFPLLVSRVEFSIQSTLDEEYHTVELVESSPVHNDIDEFF